VVEGVLEGDALSNSVVSSDGCLAVVGSQGLAVEFSGEDKITCWAEAVLAGWVDEECVLGSVAECNGFFELGVLVGVRDVSSREGSRIRDSTVVSGGGTILSGLEGVSRPCCRVDVADRGELGADYRGSRII